MANQLKWGKMNLLVSAVSLGAMGGWKEIFTPVQDSFALNVEDGEKLEAFIEGGERIAVRNDSSKYAFEFETFISRGLPKPVPDIDGVVMDEYAIALIPENKSLDGFLMRRSAVSVQESFTSKDGHKAKYTFEALKPETGRMLEQLLPASTYSLAFTSAADTTGKTITVTTDGAVTAVSDQAWATVTVSGKIVTVKVTANAGTARTANITVTSGDSIAIVTVEQAGT